MYKFIRNKSNFLFVKFIVYNISYVCFFLIALCLVSFRNSVEI